MMQKILSATEALYRGYKYNSGALSYAGLTLIISAIYFLAGRLGLMLAPEHEGIIPVWPPAGIALSALLLLGNRFWPAIFLGAFSMSILTIPVMLVSLGIAVGSTLEAVVGSKLVAKFANGIKALEEPYDVLWFSILAGGISTMIGATSGVASLLFGGFLELERMIPAWFTWWLGGMASTLVLTPLAIAWSKPRGATSRKIRLSEMFFVFAGLVATSYTIFGGILPPPFSHYPLAFLTLPWLVYTAFRFCRRETSLAILILSLIAITGTVQGFGPFALSSKNESFLLLETFIVVIAPTAMALTAVTSKEQQASAELAAREESLRLYIEELAQKKSEGEAILASIGNPIVAADKEGKIIFAGEAFAELFGYSLEELLGRPITEVLPISNGVGGKLDAAENPIGRTLAAKEKIKDVYWTQNKKGHRFPIALTATPIILGEKSIGVITVLRDITKEKELDRIKTEFISTVSYHLRTPLAVINRYLEALKSSRRRDFVFLKVKYIDEIERIVLRMNTFINNLLRVARIELGTQRAEKKPIRLKKAAEGVISAFAPKLNAKSIKLKFNPSSPHTVIRGDPVLFSIILENIVENAVKYTPPRGKITIEIKEQNEEALIIVSDTGCGIQKNDQDKIFTKFFRGNNGRQKEMDGTGLGLYIAKSLTEISGGRLYFRSEEGNGTSFFICMPLFKRKIRT